MQGQQYRQTEEMLAAVRDLTCAGKKSSPREAAWGKQKFSVSGGDHPE